MKIAAVSTDYLDNVRGACARLIFDRRNLENQKVVREQIIAYLTVG